MSDEPVLFRISIAGMLALQPHPMEMSIAAAPRYRIKGLSMKKTKADEFELLMQIDSQDLPASTPHHELQLFRDAIVSTIAVLTAMPIAMRSQGSFTFPLGDRKYTLRT